MELITIIFYLILVVYCFFILQLIYGFDKIKSFVSTNQKPKTAFSIVVPFRNEAKNLPKLLQSFSKLNYPHEFIEIIMVDDFSTDTSERICIQWRMNHDHLDTTLLENLRLSNSPKKDAIGRAMPIAKHDWIITTDADCIVNENWLMTLDNFIQQNKSIEMVVGSVVYKTKNNWFHQFQQMDLLSLQGATIGSFGIGKPFMCNGANFSYTKKLFRELNGFGGNFEMASGDDVFLLQKAIAKVPEKVHYLKNANVIVKTKPENDLHALFMQRVRWASKTSSYKGVYPKMLAFVVLLMNLSLVIVCLSTPFHETPIGFRNLVFAFLIKYCVDYILLFKTNSYLRNGAFLLPLASSLIYPFFCSWVGIYSLFGHFTWKQRSFKK